MLTELQKQRVLDTKELFVKEFKQEPTDFFQSCGRLEIIGNHVDYNGGKVINSSAGNLNIFASVCKNDGFIEIISEGYPTLHIDINDTKYRKEEEETSAGLVRGILFRFNQLGHKIGGFKLAMNSNIYRGGGVSSSASYCCLICKILSYYYNNDNIDVIEIAKISRWSENNYFGKGSGLQDEIGCCAKDFAITDYKDQENPVVTYFNVNLGDYHILLIDTKTDHSESQGGFQSIVTDMQEISQYFKVPYLIDIPFDKFMVEYNKGDNSTKRNWNRAYHFLTEIQRVDRAYEALKKSDIKAFLKEFNDSGLSSENYLKSIVAEGQTSNNLLVALHMGREILHDGAIRVHGGGFGGTCMVWVNKNEEEEFKKKMSTKFPLDQIIPVFPSEDPLRKIAIEELK